MSFNLNDVVMDPDVEKEIAAYRKNKNALDTETVRAAMSPNEYINDLLELRKNVPNMEMDDSQKCKVIIDINTTLLKKCLPDMKAIEVKESLTIKPIEIKVNTLNA